MEHSYSAYTKIVQDQTYYFVKKIMLLPELVGMADIVVGFGMHTDFEKACSIAGIDSADDRKQLLNDLEKANLPTQVAAPVQQAEEVPSNVTGNVTHWLADRAVAVLN